MAMLTWAGEALVAFEIAVLAWFVIANLWSLGLMVGATLEMRQLASLAGGPIRSRLLASPLAPSISVLAPLDPLETAEDALERVAALLALHYPNLEIVVIRDGGEPQTLRALRDHFHLVAVHPIYRRSIVSSHVRGLYRSAVYPNLVVIDKAAAGVADALNAGLNVATGDLVCATQAGVLLERDAPQRLVRPFLEDDDVLATGGSIRIANDAVIRGGRVAEARVPRRPLAALQVIEHIRTFVFGRLGWNRLGGNLILSGAFGLYRRDAVIDAGGYSGDGDADNVELVLRLRRRSHERDAPRRVVFVPDPVAWADAPTGTERLGAQRGRWQHALADAVRRHRALLFDPRYGMLGLVVLPYVVLFELMAPVVELLGILGLALGLALGVLDPAFAALFLLIAYGLSAVLTVCTLVMDELNFERCPRLMDRLWLVALALVEPLGYRQLTVFWRLQGLERNLRGGRTTPRPASARPAERRSESRRSA